MEEGEREGGEEEGRKRPMDWRWGVALGTRILREKETRMADIYEHESLRPQNLSCGRQNNVPPKISTSSSPEPMDITLHAKR